MSTSSQTPTTTRPGHAAPTRGPAPAPGAPRLNVAIDPVKLLRQYFWWLAGAGVVGVVLGVAVHVLASQFYPLFRAEAAFEFVGQIAEADEQKASVGTMGGEAEIERFIGTQELLMTSNRVLSRAVRDPRVRDETEWADQFKSGGAYDDVAARLELEEIIGTRAVPDTNIVLLRATAHTANDSAALVRAVTDEYLRQLGDEQRTGELDIESSLTNQLNAVREERRLVEDRMNRLVRDNNLTTNDDKGSAQYQQIQQLLPQLQDLRLELETTREVVRSYESQLNAPGGAVYPEDVRAIVRQHQIVLGLEMQIASAKADYEAKLRRLGPNHVESKRLERQIEGFESQLSAQTEKILAQTFQEFIEANRMRVAQLEAAEADTVTALERAQRDMSDIKAVLDQYDLLAADAERLGDAEQDLKTRLESYRARASRDIASRVLLQYGATPPDQPYFPLWYIVIPTVWLVVIGLTGGVILLKELAEQRVRGPADVLLVPRTRVLGIVPQLNEDPSRPKSIERAVRTEPSGIIAESIRHIRTTLLKQMKQKGHKTLVVFGGMPGSGATSIVANLGASSAACEMRVLVIDANFRRARLHEVLDVSDGLGLADVLARTVALEDAVAQTDIEGLRVLRAGTPHLRMSERLTTSAIDTLLAEARQMFDLIIIDAPPVIVSSDSIGLAGRCDAAALVVRAYGEKRGLVARVRGQLEEARADFLGVIVNAVRASAGGYFRRNFQTAHEYVNGHSRAQKKRRDKDAEVADFVTLNGDSKHHDN